MTSQKHSTHHRNQTLLPGSGTTVSKFLKLSSVVFYDYIADNLLTFLMALMWMKCSLHQVAEYL